jgi:type VI secretion system secreted protein VgrG
VLFAGQHLHWTTQGDVHMTAAYTLSSVAANAAGYFSHAGGIQAIAANGPVSLQAHTDQLEILADKSIKVISVNDSIEIKASQKIVLQAGQSSITLEGGDITFACPGNFTVKGGQHVFEGGARASASLPQLPEGELPKDTLYLDHRYHDDQPLAGADYVVRLADGTERKGMLDSQGRAVLTGIPIGVAQVSFGPMPGAFQRVDKTPMPNYDAEPSDAKVDGLIDKYFKSDDSSDSVA